MAVEKVSCVFKQPNNINEPKFALPVLLAIISHSRQCLNMF